MKQRITYLSPEGSAVDPSDVHVGDDNVNITTTQLPAVEKRITAGLSELPVELRNAFQDIHEIHVRYVSRLNYQAASPLVSRLPPGLHVFFTPRHADSDVDICPLLHQVFSPDLRCHSISDSFSTSPILSERFSSASAFQYFHRLPRLLHFQTWLARTFCPGVFRGRCPNEAASLSYASHVDIDFDAISHAVTVTAFWRAGITAEAARMPARKVRAGDSLEVGVLVPEKADEDEPESLKMGGFLAVAGEDDGPTLFSFPSRHHPLPPTIPGIFSVSFQQPTGLHPNLDIILPQRHLAPPKDDGSCALHAYLTLPSALFLDRYQLEDTALLASHNLTALRSLSGEQDLEAPDWVVKRWGSAALIELASPRSLNRSTLSDRQPQNWTATIPLHLRYLRTDLNTSDPTTSTSPGYIDLDVPWPIVFWACEAEAGLKMSVNPFDRVNLGYDGLFGPKTMFYHIPPAPAVEGQVMMLEERIRVPVLEPVWGAWVQWGTLVAVLVGFGWVGWGLLEGGGLVGGKRKEMVAKEHVTAKEQTKSE